MQTNTENNIPKKASKIFIIVVSAAAFIAGYFLFTQFFSSKSEFDVTNKENSKIVPMFDKQLQANINNHEQNTFNPGYLSTAKQYVASYLKTITEIESYSRYGVTSAQARNAIEVRLKFADGTTVEKVYTGKSSSHIMPPPLLIKVILKDGKTVKVFTNGMEKSGSPEWIIPDLNNLIHAAISYDKQRNHNSYYPAQKSKQDFEKEWEEQ